MAERLLAAGIFLLPLAWVPWLDGAFTAPKLLLLAALGAVGCVTCVLHRDKPRGGGDWGWLAWPASVAVSALAGRYVSFEALAAALAPLALWRAVRRMRFERFERALLASSAVESGIALLQYCGLDPLRLFDWNPEIFANSRMRVYGTLGNPDFVAAWLCATLPLWASAPLRSKAVRYAGAALQLAAIFATGSRVFLLAMPAAAIALVLCGVRPRKSWAAVVPVAAALLWLSPARSLGETIEGRLYLAEAAASGWRNIPLTGYGPGSFPIQFAQAQIDWLRQHPADPARQFAGFADHAHNDYIELLVEYGPVGFCALLALCGCATWKAWHTRNAGVWAGTAALLAAALVDFPLHRTAEWTLFWLLLGMLASGSTKGDLQECTER